MSIRDSQDLTLIIEQISGNIRDSQDLTLVIEQVTGNIRDSQDLTLVIEKVTGNVRDSQEVLLVIQPSVQYYAILNVQPEQFGNFKFVVPQDANESFLFTARRQPRVFIST